MSDLFHPVSGEPVASHVPGPLGPAAENAPPMGPSRRTVMGGIILALSPLPWIAPASGASPQGQGLSPADHAQAALIGDRPVLPGVVAIDAPALAENGATVPITLRLRTPTEPGIAPPGGEPSLPPGVGIIAFHLIAEANPLPLIASFTFSPAAVPFAKVRIRLAETQVVRLIAQRTDGQVHGLRQEIKVTLGGCGG